MIARTPVDWKGVTNFVREIGCNPYPRIIKLKNKLKKKKKVSIEDRRKGGLVHVFCILG